MRIRPLGAFLASASAVFLTSASLVNAAPNLKNNAIRSLALIDADSGKPINKFKKLDDGAVIDLGKISTDKLNIEANTIGAVKSARFELDNSYNYVDSNSPFYFCGS